MWRSLILGWTVLIAVPQPGLAQQQPESEATPDKTESPIRSNHFVPFIDIVAFDFLLNRFF
jgi:hypothetical protein